MYSLGSFIGFFAIMLVLMVIAIATAKSNFCWLFYAAGGVLQLFSLLGRSKTLNQWGFLLKNEASYKAGTALRWIVYLLIMIISLIVISKRRHDHMEEEYYKNTATQSSKSNNQPQSSTSRMEPKADASAAANTPSWQCECGRTNADYVMTCACGITKKEMKLRNAADKNSTV